jgi:hypothetical protein
MTKDDFFELCYQSGFDVPLLQDCLVIQKDNRHGLIVEIHREPQANSVLYTEVPTAWDDEGEPTEWEHNPTTPTSTRLG